MTVRFGVLFPFVDGLVDSGPFLRQFLTTVEDCGADSVWSVEHVIVADRQLLHRIINIHRARLKAQHRSQLRIGDRGYAG